MTDPDLPRATVAYRLSDGRWRAACPCDWHADAADRTAAVEAAVEHARGSSWCRVHRNLTPVGADPVLGDG